MRWLPNAQTMAAGRNCAEGRFGIIKTFASLLWRNAVTVLYVEDLGGPRDCCMNRVTALSEKPIALLLTWAVMKS
jgi:hypothetical protein